MVKWFNDLNIKSKLLLSFSIVAFIAALIGYMGYRGLSDLAERQDYLATNSLSGIKNLGEISNRINQIVVGERGLINDRFMESSVRQAQYKFIKDGWALLNEAKINYELIPESGEILSGWNEFIPHFENWKKTNEELLRISEEMDKLISAGEAKDSPRLQELNRKAIDKYFEGRISYLQANKLLNVLIDAHSAEAARLDEETDVQVASSISLLAGLTILGFLAAVALGGFISGTINRPVKKVLFMAEELQKGHIKARADVNTSDELGRMAQALDKFALQVDVSLIGTLNKIAQGEVSFTVPFYDEKDEIAPVLNRLTSTVRDVINETKHLTEAAVEGNLSLRGNAVKFTGGFHEIVDGINKTMDAAILPVKEGSDVLAQMAKGDLTIRVKGEYKGDHQIIKTSINQLADSMSQAIMEVGMAVDATASAANQISSSSEEMAAGASEQTQQVNEIAGAVEEMTRTIFANSQNTTSAAENSKLSNQSAKEGTLKVEETQRGMRKIVDATSQTAEKIAFLAKKTDEIGEITQVIDDIADQTNLLALNAAIEAARAGEQGRGFAVVADEVRKLAERTTKATKEIAQTIKAIQAEAREADSSMASAGRAVEEGMRMTDEVEEVLKLIYSSNEKSSDLITQVAASSEEQSATAEQISRNIDGISGITQQSAAGAEQIARAAEDLSRLTHNLQGLVNRFKLDYTAGANYKKDRITVNKHKAVLS